MAPEAVFTLGFIHDNWFTETQGVTCEYAVHPSPARATSSDAMPPPVVRPWARPDPITCRMAELDGVGRPLEPAESEERVKLGKMRDWGSLLGLSKQCIEQAVDEGDENTVAELRKMLTTFLSKQRQGEVPVDGSSGKPMATDPKAKKAAAGKAAHQKASIGGNGGPKRGAGGGQRGRGGRGGRGGRSGRAGGADVPEGTPRTAAGQAQFFHPGFNPGVYAGAMYTATPPFPQAHSTPTFATPRQLAILASIVDNPQFMLAYSKVQELKVEFYSENKELSQCLDLYCEVGYFVSKCMPCKYDNTRGATKRSRNMHLREYDTKRNVWLCGGLICAELLYVP